ncbi:hypothetical protein GSI_03342 [Ganoderma sinense ZZ0214-1]|uniref:Uncharacterized protein n=1 Tax=Ganoderma sinense ZZ0214-1 TaxID=1077348 RepID=A0A2G8SLD0_9APHY|nr:hypothetical protein GSI_03342 [Ganoderma sinense ZZ0214-1]
MHLHQLPTEIILMIFHDLYNSLDFPHIRPIRRKDVKPELKFMLVQAVCRRWRDMIRGTPYYWRVINVYSKQDWLRLCLARSAGKKTPTSVYFRKFNIPPPLLQLLSLPSHIPHIRHLSFNVDDDHFDSLRHFFSRQFPNLSTLELECPTHKMWMPSKPLSLPSHNLPRLENLVLFTTKPPEDLGVYTNLHSLELSAVPLDVSWDTMLEVLNACAPKLERLGLVHILSDVSVQPDLHSGPSPVTFPRLKMIHVANKLPYLARILSHFRVPAGIDVYLMDNIMGRQADEVTALEQAFIPMLPPDPATIVPHFSSVMAVRYTAWESEFTFIGTGEGELGVHLELYRHDDDPPLAWGSLGRKGLMELLGLLSRADVRLFEIAVDYDTLGADDFEAVFKAFPKLETLNLNGGGSFDYILELLGSKARSSSIAPPSSSADEEDKAPEASEAGPDSMWCPNLKAVIIGDVDDQWSCDDDLLDKIVQVLRARAQRGLRLDRFEIRLLHNTEEEYLEAQAKYLPQLQALVGEVVYGNHKPDDGDCSTCGSDLDSESEY